MGTNFPKMLPLLQKLMQVENECSCSQAHFDQLLNLDLFIWLLSGTLWTIIWPYHCYQNLKFSFLPFLFTTLNSCTDYVHSKCFQSSLNFSIIQKLFYLFYSAIFPHSLQWLIKSVRFLFSCFSLILRLLGSLILPLLKPCCMFNSGFGTSYPKVLDFKDLKSVTKGRE